MLLLRSLIAHGRIRTTLAKAQAIQPTVDKIITSLGKNSSAGRTSVRSLLADEASVTALRAMVKDRFGTRKSGFTRIIRLGVRRGDAAEEVFLEFVDAAPVTGETVKQMSGSTKKTKETAKEAEVVKEKPAKRARKNT